MGKRGRWLKEMYPKGVGLGTLVNLYMNYLLQEGEEAGLRASELVLLMNNLYKFHSTPVFPDEFDGTYMLYE